jgi:hypothetical protein
MYQRIGALEILTVKTYRVNQEEDGDLATSPEWDVKALQLVHRSAFHLLGK